MSTKFVAATAALLLGSALSSIGCSDTTKYVPESGTSLGTPSVSGGQTADKNSIFGTIQGAILDAVTNQPIAGSDLQLYLLVGSQQRTPDVLVRDPSSALAGEFAFSNVPLDVSATDARYKVVAVKGGYQRFEGYVTGFTATLVQNNVPIQSSSSPASGTGVSENPNALDTIYTKVANVYLFPLGLASPDVQVDLTWQGEVVPGATLLLQQNIDLNSPTGSTGSAGDRVPAAPGLTPSLSALTDVAGHATFAGANLVLGGSYTLMSLPVGLDGVQLPSSAPQTFVLGVTDGSAVQELKIGSDLEPGSNQTGLFAEFASNRDTRQITGLLNPGVLTIVFSQPIALVSESEFTAALTGATQATLQDSGQSPSVVAAVSADGFTLTLTPQFETAPTAADVGLAVVYSGGRVTLEGQALNAALFVFGEGSNVVTLADGNPISSTVQVLGPQQP